MPRKPAQKKIEAAIEALDDRRTRWLRRPGVTAVDVGYKITEDKGVTSQLALRVHVEKKIHPSDLPAHELFNVSAAHETKDLKPETVDGFPVDVIEATYVPDQAAAPVVLDPEDTDSVEAFDRRGVVNPLIGGISCGNPRVTAGTLGSIVFDRTDCSPQILSNWHVLAGSPDAAAGEEIWQPGRVDGGNSTLTVARLNRFRLDKHMDAAIATLTGARPHVRDIIGLRPVTGMESPQLGMQVVKSGRTTGNTEGVIDGVSLSTSINYRSPTGVVQFRNQIHIVPRPPWPQQDYEVSEGGDSGSVWINEASGKAVGLHFAGERDTSPTAENAVASPIEKVAEELNFSFLPLVCPPPPPVPPPRPRPPRDSLRALLCRLFPFLCFGFQGAGPQGTHVCTCGAPHPPQAPQPGVEWQGRDIIDAMIDAIYADIDRGDPGSS